MSRNVIPVTIATSVATILTACSDYSKSERYDESSTSTTTTATSRPASAREWPVRQAEDTISQFKYRDHTLERFFNGAYGYAVFPDITKGAIGVGAAHGDDGVVYEQGAVVGYADVTQVNIGVQLGGQSFAEIIFFENDTALRHFKQNKLEFAANASAVAAASGAAAAADYHEGVAVFTMPLGGLMFEASIGGQKFHFYPR